MVFRINVEPEMRPAIRCRILRFLRARAILVNPAAITETADLVEDIATAVRQERAKGNSGYGDLINVLRDLPIIGPPAGTTGAMIWKNGRNDKRKAFFSTS